MAAKLIGQVFAGWRVEARAGGTTNSKGESVARWLMRCLDCDAVNYATTEQLKSGTQHRHGCKTKAREGATMKEESHA